MKTHTNSILYLTFFIFCFGVFFSCKKIERPVIKSSLNAETTPVRYRDSVFANVDTSSLVNVFYRYVQNYSGYDSLKLDVFLPVGDTVLKRAALIFTHGGGFAVGPYTRKSPPLRYFCEQLAKKGYVVIAPTYRLGTNWPPLGSPGTLSAERYYETIYRAVQDIRACVRFVKAASSVGKIDTNKIFIGGESAGAITAINTAYLEGSEIPLFCSERWGPLDGNQHYDYPSYSTNLKGVINVEGVALDTNFIDPGNLPVISFFGASEEFYLASSTRVYNSNNGSFITVTFHNGQLLHARMANLNITASSINVHPGVHGSSLDISNRATTVRLASEWMYSRLQQ